MQFTSKCAEFASAPDKALTSGRCSFHLLHVGLTWLETPGPSPLRPPGADGTSLFCRSRLRPNRGFSGPELAYPSSVPQVTGPMKTVTFHLYFGGFDWRDLGGILGPRRAPGGHSRHPVLPGSSDRPRLRERGSSEVQGGLRSVFFMGTTMFLVLGAVR